MEPSIIFAEIVLGMCAIHLIRQSSDQIAKWWAKSRPDQVSRTAGKKVVRDDWYVFFNCSDLLGKDAVSEKEQDRKSADKPTAKRSMRPVVRA